MIPLGIVASAHKFASAANPTIELNQTDSSSGHNGDTSISWTGIDFGTAETGRLVCVMVTGGLQQTTTDTVTNYMTVTIGGQTATLLVGHNEALYRAIWAVQLDTGTSGTVTITLSGGKTLGGEQQITSFSVYDADISNIATAEDLSKRGTFNTTANFSLSPTTDAGGAVVYGVSGTDIQTFPSWSFTNATELADFRGGTSPHSVGFAELENTSTSETISNTCADTVVDRPGAIAVSFLASDPYQALTLDTVDVRDPAGYELNTLSNVSTAYGVHKVKFTADSTSHTLYIGFELRGTNSAFYKDYTVAGVRLRYGATTDTFADLTWTGWTTTRAGVPSSTSPTGLIFYSLVTGTTGDRFNLDASGTGSSHTGMANGISTTSDFDGNTIAQVSGEYYAYVETSSPMVNGDTIWLRKTFNPSIGDEVRIDIADYLNTSNTGTYASVVQNSVRILVT